MSLLTQRQNKKYLGATSILLVIIISSILIALTITSLYIAIDFSKFRAARTAKATSEVAIDSCFEEGMRLIKLNHNISGSRSVVVNDFTCEYDFTIVDGSHTDMDLSVTIAESSKSKTVTVNTSDNPLSYSY